MYVMVKKIQKIERPVSSRMRVNGNSRVVQCLSVVIVPPDLISFAAGKKSLFDIIIVGSVCVCAASTNRTVRYVWHDGINPYHECQI